MQAQILTNNGAIITASPRAVVFVNGSAWIKSGEMSFADRAELRISGKLTFDSGLMLFAGISTGYIADDCYIGERGNLRRLGQGTLYLYRFTHNKGIIENEGTIEYGQP